MFIESLKREVTLCEETRKIMREVNECLLNGVELNNLDGSDLRFPASNADKAEELKIKLLTGLSQDEINNLTAKEYNKLKEEISKKK